MMAFDSLVNFLSNEDSIEIPKNTISEIILPKMGIHLRECDGAIRLTRKTNKRLEVTAGKNIIDIDLDNVDDDLKLAMIKIHL